MTHRVIQGQVHNAISVYPNANGVSLFSCRSRMNCQSDKNIKCNRASMLHNSSTRRHARVRIVWINQGSSRSACLTCIWRREYQWIGAWRTHRPSVCMMESWVRFSAQSQAKERVFRYTNTHCMHVYSTTTTGTTWKCCTESWSHYRNNTVFFSPNYLTISNTNNKAVIITCFWWWYLLRCLWVPCKYGVWI